MAKKRASGEKVTVLDYVKGIEVPGDVFAKPANEYWALLCLRDGMHFLARQAAQVDETVRQRANPEGKLRIVMAGNDPAFSGIPMGLLTCAFHWYAVSACQYVRTVGAIAYRRDNTRPLPPKYVAAVIPEVLAFRDKVAAHFAWATRHERDNEADRVASILPALTFDSDGFYVGSWTVRVRSGGKTSDSSALRRWSITKVHRQLCERYWPDAIQRHEGSRGADEGGES